MGYKNAKEVIIGITTVISLALLYIGINYLKGINLFKPANYYYVSCHFVKDINVSSPVFVEGFKVGLVRSIEYDYSTVDKIMLEIRLDRGMKVNKGSYVMIESTLLSGAELHLHLNKMGSEYHKAGDTLEGRFREGMMTSVEGTIIPQLTVLFVKLDSILTGIHTLVNNTSLTQSLSNLERTTAQLEQSSIRLNELLRKDVPEISSGLKATTDHLTTFSQKLNDLKIDESILSLNTTLENFQMFSGKLNAKDNAIGLLLNDTLLYRNLNTTIESANGLLIDLRQNPKKYVHFSLWGK